MAEVLDSSFAGNYKLHVFFRREPDVSLEDPVILEPQNIRELSITMDINRYLPSFHMVVNDSAGVFSNYLPFDRIHLSRLQIEIGGYMKKKPEDITQFFFDVYRRKPTEELLYDMEGLLAINSFFSPSRIRGFTGMVSETIATLASEAGVNRMEISSSLNYKLNILQPNWTNGELLFYLQDNLIGITGETGFFCFVKTVGLNNVLVFASLNDLLLALPKYKFILSPNPIRAQLTNTSEMETFLPITDYRVIDNYKLLGVSGCKQQDYMYYDYYNSGFKKSSILARGGSNPYISLTNHFLIDEEDVTTESKSIDSCGRSNDFTRDFKGLATNTLHKRITDLSKIWITTYGIDDIFPGDIVEIVRFPNLVIDVSHPGASIYTGYYLVERVVHVIGHNYVTRLLLTRNGINTILPTSLMKADPAKKKI
jgi:hypothetical protein